MADDWPIVMVDALGAHRRTSSKRQRDPVHFQQKLDALHPAKSPRTAEPDAPLVENESGLCERMEATKGRVLFFTHPCTVYLP